MKGGTKIKKVNYYDVEEKNMEELFEQIRRYGSFLAEFGCTNDLGMALRVRVAEYDGKKYFIVQCDGIISELFEI